MGATTLRIMEVTKNNLFTIFLKAIENNNKNNVTHTIHSFSITREQYNFQATFGKNKYEHQIPEVFLLKYSSHTTLVSR